MNKQILIPTDFSKNALNAVRYTIDLYSKLNCDFYLLNVLDFERYTTENLIIPESGSAAFELAKEDTEKKFQKLLHTLALHNDNPKHRYHTITTLDFLLEAMKKIITEKDVDLVAMGTKGATGSKKVFFGSNTVNAMEKIRECPVLAIPDEISYTTPKEIVFPTDYKAKFKRKELSYLIEIGKMHHSNIAVLHLDKNNELSGDQEANKQLLNTILEETPHSFHDLTESNLAKGIQTFIESRDSNMMAFINRKHVFFGSVFSKPLLKEIGYEATVPILALH
ncbi:universal stress protein [Maribacter thermophilus]|uniref:universal stress protein n=1 Tax=Maribacter thermophilus TaxID=1197874 RepID=UPI000640D7EA|nr:universal stress protein [Maribacter thermophilus]